LIPRRKHICADLTKCYSVFSVEKSAEDGLGDPRGYENGQEGHPSKARVMKLAHKKIEKIVERLRIQPLQGGNLLYIT